MTSRDFCYWLQGWFELNEAGPLNLSTGQTEVVRRHLAMVFAHEIDPTMGDQQHQDTLTDLHTPAGELSPMPKHLFPTSVLRPTPFEILPQEGRSQTSISGRSNNPVKYRC